MPDVTLDPFARPFERVISIPGSKSLTNRALVLAALSDGRSRLSNVLLADDTRAMLDGLRKLGFELTTDEIAAEVTIMGQGGHVAAFEGGAESPIYCNNSGTTIRFLTALSALGHGAYPLDGNPRMRQRPIGPLIEMLTQLGSRAEYQLEKGYPPVTIFAEGLPGGVTSYGSVVSSQYLSAVLMIAPYAAKEVRVVLTGRQSSWPYVAMTMRLMDGFGVTPEITRDPHTGDPKEIHIPQGSYKATDYAIEPDASNATYFLAAAALHPGAKLTVAKLGRRSLQGDVGFAEVLRKMGAEIDVGADSLSVTGPSDGLEGIDVDLLSMPDTAQTLAVVALFARGRTTIRGLHTLKVKETDRLAALAAELTKLGAKVEIVGGDMLIIEPPSRIASPVSIATYDDHRMAMSFALVGTKVSGIMIAGAECVNKTYPAFFQDLEKLRV